MTSQFKRTIIIVQTYKIRRTLKGTYMGKRAMLSSICGILSVLIPPLVVQLDFCHCQDRILEGIEEGTKKLNEATIHNRGVRLSLNKNKSFP